jgi:hypothetical protein
VQTLKQYPFDYLINEAYSLLSRLKQVKPFSMTMPMVRGASVSDKSLKAVIDLLENGKSILGAHVHRFIQEVKRSKKNIGEIQNLQARFTILKLRYNSILDQLDIFADVLSQRAEHEVGIWLSGLDVLAEDGLVALTQLAELPSLMVYLDRGHGAAIRRARTRLPGGDENPVGVIQIPRERMVGSGIASSLIHEVGHQAAALLDLVSSLKNTIIKKQQEGKNTIAWKFFERWISEIIADVWAVGHLGIAATLGLMGVVTLPKYFQFRFDLNDPHPAPYVRVQLSCVFGKKMFPHKQWDDIWELWKTFYEKNGLKKETIQILNDIEREAGSFADLLLNHSTQEMKGKKLIELFPLMETNPVNLKQLYKLWKTGKTRLQAMRPTLVFAMLGQAKFNLAIDAAEESNVLMQRLRQWAFNRK